MNEKNHDPLKSLEDLLKRIESALERNPKKKGNMDEKNDKKNNDNDMVFFSLDNPQFVSGGSTEFLGDADALLPTEGSIPQDMKISPDLAEFFLRAGLLLHDALYLPFRSRQGRLADFFSWVEKARDRMDQKDFTDLERNQFSEWCQGVGNTLIEAQNKHGLWLTDDEEDLVLAMTNGDLWSENRGENDVGF